MKLLLQSYRLIALTMAFVMFASSVNLAIDMHFCQGQFKSLSFFGKAKSCHEIVASKAASCPHHKKMMEAKEGCVKNEKDCCSSQSIHIQADSDQLNSNSGVETSQELQQFIVAFVKVFFKNISVKKSNSTFTNYVTPKITRDTYVLFQTFLL